MKARPPKIIHDTLHPMPSHLLTLTLSDMMIPPPQRPNAGAGVSKGPTALPEGHVLVYFPLQTPSSQLAPDAADADHVPPGMLPPSLSSSSLVRRLWAGGSLTYRAGSRKRLLLDGRSWTCREEIEDARGTEDKCFVKLRRSYGLNEVDVCETRTLVFLRNRAAAPGNEPRKKGGRADHEVAVLPSATHLFHFSALSYNAHRIHIDPVYAKGEGYQGLLVHGPLLLALMIRIVMEYVRASTAGPKRLAEFVYRNHASLYVDEKATVKLAWREGNTYDVWVENAEGDVAVKGTATVEDGT